MPKIRKPPSVLREERIVKALKKALIDKDWTVKHLAELCGKHEDVVGRIINHPMQRRFGDVLTVANKLGLDSIPI